MEAVGFCSLLVILLFSYLTSWGKFLLDYPLVFALILGTVWFFFETFHPNLRRTSFQLLFVLYLLYVLSGWATRATALHFGFEPERIAVVHGVLVEDSSLTKSDHQLIRLRLQGCRTTDGNSCSSRGILTASLPLNQCLVAHTKLTITGHIESDGTLFFADTVQVLDVPVFSLVRRNVLTHLVRRAHAMIADEQTCSLALMLLLGQTTENGFLLKDLSIGCGCAHTLALSGMHLHVFLLLSSLVASRICGRFWGRRLGSIIPMLYVLLAGPKPSLVRALFMHLLSLLPFSSCFPVFCSTYLLQLLLFPESVTSAAFLLSYTAYSMLLASSFVPPFPLRTTALAILGTAPASLLLFGSWNLGGLFYGPLVTVLVNMAMVLSLLSLLYGHWCSSLLELDHHLLVKLLSYGFSHTRSLGLSAYLCYLLVLLTCVVAIGYAKQVLYQRRRKRHELELCLRFPQCHNETAAATGAFHDQEVWTELPPLKPGS